MPDQTVNFGVIGCGLMGREFASASLRWLHLLGDIPRPAIIAACDTNAQNLDWFRRDPDTKYFYNDYQEMLKNPEIEAVYVNGDLEQRVPHNLNISFAYVEGESMLMAVKDLAVSSGSACTSASLEPSYVLRALGRNDELAHSSIRFTLGRFTTEEEIDYTVQLMRAKIGKLRELSPLWEMVQEGVDLNTVQWAAH